MKANGGYVKGIGYALNEAGRARQRLQLRRRRAPRLDRLGLQLRSRPPTSCWQAAKASGSVNNVTGFITNTANYSALKRAVLQLDHLGERHQRPPVQVGRLEPVRRRAHLRAGLPHQAGLGRLQREHRHADRHLPQRLGRLQPPDRGEHLDRRRTPSSTQSRIDRRIHAGNWCNQSGAGLGERPRPPRPPASTPTSGSSPRASRTARAPSSRTTRARASTGCATRPTPVTPATATA